MPLPESRPASDLANHESAPVTLLFLAHVASTLTMLGVILIVQVVHYPLFGHVGEASYAAYQSEHMARITWIVLPAMTVELATAAALAWWQPLGLPGWAVWTGLALVAVIWASTALIQVPLHSTLTHGFDADAHRALVLSNWIRTAAWTARSALVLWLTYRLLTP